MTKGCQARIRGYLSKARSQLFGAKFDNIATDTSKHKASTSATEGLTAPGNKKTSTKLRRKVCASQSKPGTTSREYSGNGEDEELEEEYWDEIPKNFKKHKS